jgi:hypothetical protein
MGKVTEAGKKFYEEKLKAILEPQENGKFVAIEPETKKYFLAATALEAIKTGNSNFPDKILFLARVGFPAAHKIGGYGYYNRKR